MGIRLTPAVVADALASGAVVTAWYALPDVVRSPQQRGAIKVGLLAAGAIAGATLGARVAAEVAASERTDDDRAEAGGSAVDPFARIRELTSGVPVLDASAAGLDEDAFRPSPRQVAALAAGVAAVGLGIAGTVATERAIHRWGERMRARGVSAPHTRIGLVSGVAAVAVALAASELERTHARGTSATLSPPA